MTDKIFTVELAPYYTVEFNNKRRKDGTLLYPDKPDGESESQYFDGRDALAHLLAEEQVGINSHWWKHPKHEDESPWCEEACKTFSINANCSDIFAWGCSDAEEVMFNELEDLYAHYTKDPLWGVVIWCIKKRKEMPQKPVEERIRAAGIWDLDSMGLEVNFYDWNRSQAREAEKS